MVDILTVPMEDNDADASTVGEYLSRLLSELWRYDEGFSGKRPFGNSGWKYDVYLALVQASLVTGVIEDGYLESVDSDAADNLIQEAIARMGKPKGVS